jgi:hypothetical protein
LTRLALSEHVFFRAISRARRTCDGALFISAKFNSLPPWALHKAEPRAANMTRHSMNRGRSAERAAHFRSNPMTEDQFAAEVMRRFKGRIVLALGAAAGVGFVLGAILF